MHYSTTHNINRRAQASGASTATCCNNIIQVAPLALLLVYDARFACTSDVHLNGTTHLTVKL